MTPSPGQAIEMKFPCREAGQKKLTFSSPKGARKKKSEFSTLYGCVQILTGNTMLSPTKLTLSNHTFKFRQTNKKKKTHTFTILFWASCVTVFGHWL
ncbi:hypothetical protein ACRRTK_022880 [Alexandromys fortis]